MPFLARPKFLFSTENKLVEPVGRNYRGFLTVGSLLFAGAILVAFVFVLSLIYFEVIPLSDVTGKLATLRGGGGASYACPIAKGICRKGEAFTVPGTNPQVLGIGWKNLSATTPIYALMDGEARPGVTFKNGEATVVTLSLRSQDGSEAVYRFSGEDASISLGGTIPVLVKKGDPFGMISGGSVFIDSPSGGTFSFAVTVQDANGLYKKLTPADFR